MRFYAYGEAVHRKRTNSSRARHVRVSSPEEVGCIFEATQIPHEKDPSPEKLTIEKNESTTRLHITHQPVKSIFAFALRGRPARFCERPIAKQRVTTARARHYYGASAAPWQREALAHRRLRQRRVVRRQGGSVPLARLVRRRVRSEPAHGFRSETWIERAKWLARVRGNRSRHFARSARRRRRSAAASDRGERAHVRRAGRALRRRVP